MKQEALVLVLIWQSASQKIVIVHKPKQCHSRQYTLRLVSKFTRFWSIV